MKKYTWILFDIDNTLLDFYTGQKDAFFSVCRANQIEASDANLELFKAINRKEWEKYEKGIQNKETTLVQRFELLLLRLNKEGDALDMNKNFLTYLSQCPNLIEYTHQILKYLSGKYKMVIVTNGKDFVQKNRIRITDIGKYFEQIFTSDELGIGKPKIDFFNIVHEAIGHPTKDELILIGDSLSADIQGGLNFGIDTVWFNPKGLINQTDIKPSYEIKHLKELQGIL